MKKLFLLLILTAFSTFGAQEWTDLGMFVFIRTAEIENHTYVVVERTGGGVSIIHAESCKCKSAGKVTADSDDRGPRLFPKTMRIRKYEEQNGICPHCTNHFEFAEMQGDHIVPYSKGGKTVYENLQMLCIRCNQSKGNKYSY